MFRPSPQWEINQPEVLRFFDVHFKISFAFKLALDLARGKRTRWFEKGYA